MTGSSTVGGAVRSGGRWTTAVDDAVVAIALAPSASAAAQPGAPSAAGEAPSVAVAGAGGLLTILTADGREVARATAAGGLLTVGWSADGTALAAGGPEGAFRWTAAGGLQRLPVSGWCSALAWSAGRLAVADGRSAAVLDDLSAPGEARLAWRTDEVASTVTSMVWLRDGRELALAAYGGVRAFARGRKGPVRELDYAGSLLATDVSPDGRWLVSGNQDASIHVWRVRDGAEFEMAGFGRKVTEVVFDTSGRWLAANGATDCTVWDFAGRGPGGTSPRLLSGHPDGATAMAWHPHLPVLATGGASTGPLLWDVTRCVPGRPAPPQVTVEEPSAAGGGIAAMAWNPDGTTLLVARSDGTVSALSPLPTP